MVLFVKKCLLSAIPASKVEGSHFRHRKFAENVPVQSFVQFIHPGAYQRACSCISSRRELQRGPSCKSPDSQYATTDICGSTPAVRCRRNEGTCTRHHAHKYLWQGIHCQVNCTSVLLTIVPCDVDVGVPIWVREIFGRDGREDIRRWWRWIVEKSEDDADVRGDIPGW